MKTLAVPLEPFHNVVAGQEDSLGASRLIHDRHGSLPNRLTNILSASFADAEIRDTVRILDRSSIENTLEVRRRLRFDVQKEVIDCNAGIINAFGAVAQVR